MSLPANSSTSSAPAVGSFAWAQILLVRNERLSAEESALLLEHNFRGAIPADLWRAVIRTLRRESRRGPKRRMTRAQEDFLIADIIERVEEKRKEFAEADREARQAAKAKGDILPRAERSPSERALQFVLNEKRSELGVVTLETLRNRISRARRAPWPDDPDEC